MPSIRAPRHWWVAAAAAAVWALAFLPGHEPSRVLLPLAFAVGCALLWRAPLAGALLVCAAQAAGLLLGVPTDNVSGLVAGLLTVAVLGAHAPLRIAVPLLAVVFAIIVVTGLPLVRVLVGFALFTATLALGRLASHGARAARAARTRADDLARQDVAAVTAAVVAEERRHLTHDVLAVVRTAVADMHRDALAAADGLDGVRIAAVRQRGVIAVTELRHLLGLLRAEPYPAPPRAVDPKTPVLAGDLATAAALSLLAVAELALTTDPTPSAVTTALSLVTCAALVVRRTAPAAAGLVAAAAAGLALAAAVPLSHGLAESLALAALAWTLAGTGRRWYDGAAWAALVVTTLAVAHQSSVSHLVVAAAVLAVATVGGYTGSRARRARSDALGRVSELEAELAGAVRSALAADRARTARELHDVTSHALGVMMLQAGAAEVLAGSDPPAARDALLTAARAGDDALRELTTLGAVLDRPLTATPARFTAAVRALADRIAGTGAEVRVRHLADLPAGEVATAAYRVVQEALTNAVKHAPGAPVEVEVAYDAATGDPEAAGRVAGADGTVRVAVRSGAGSASGPGHGSRVGLTGLSDRVHELGGTLTAGPSPDGGFVVVARIPLARTAAALTSRGAVT